MCVFYKTNFRNSVFKFFYYESSFFICKIIELGLISSWANNQSRAKPKIGHRSGHPFPQAREKERLESSGQCHGKRSSKSFVSPMETPSSSSSPSPPSRYSTIRFLLFLCVWMWVQFVYEIWSFCVFHLQRRAIWDRFISNFEEVQARIQLDTVSIV